MHNTRRRLSPSLIIATVALVAALGGTAIAAGEIITSPDQVKREVLDGRHIRPEALSNSQLRDPQLKQRVSASGERIGSGDATVSRAGQGLYDVTFREAVLNAGTSGPDTVLNENCAITATSRQTLAVMSIDGPTPQQPNTVRVRATFPQNVSGGVLMSAVDSAFDVTASC